MNKYLFTMILLLILGCTGQKKADLIVYNAKIYTVDAGFTIAECFAVKDGKILAVGKKDDIIRDYIAPEKFDAGGKFIYPGFIDAHCHFYNYGLSLQRADLNGTKSFEEVLEVLKKFNDEHHPAWLTGRGWDQNDWPIKEFPDNKKLDELFPSTPVMITRVDGHAALVNSFVLNKAGISSATKVEGGEIVQRNGKLTGLLIDNAMDLVTKLIPKPGSNDKIRAFEEAEKNCFSVGLTTVADAGLDKEVILLIQQLQDSGKLRMKIYAMLNPTEENFNYFMNKGIYKTDRLDIRSVKLYADGALGSRGACLLKPYSDDPGNYGLMVESDQRLKELCQNAYDHGYQVNVHAIGDSGVRTVLKIFGEVLGGPNDRRWRVEHAQFVAPEDFVLFGRYSVIPSVQPTHATSDMYWAAERLGGGRITSAYAYRKLMEQNGWIAFGTDFPIEKIDPLLTFYAAVFRQDLQGFPENGWQMENAITREQALRAMTIWAARSCYEDEQKGSLEPGKSADFVILDRDIMKSEPKEILKTRIISTFINGEKVYQATL